MPGLLQVPDDNLKSWKLVYALLAECVGTLIFSLYGSATTLSGNPLRRNTEAELPLQQCYRFPEACTDVLQRNFWSDPYTVFSYA